MNFSAFKIHNLCLTNEKKKKKKMKPEKKKYSNSIEFLSNNRICKYSNTSNKNSLKSSRR
jgi:hypothetical protein